MNKYKYKNKNKFVKCVIIELQALLQGFKLVCNIVQVLSTFKRIVGDCNYKSDVCYKSSASLVLYRASRVMCQRKSIKEVDIRVSFLGVYVSKFSII
jgi:hypothetical protein